MPFKSRPAQVGMAKPLGESPEQKCFREVVDELHKIDGELAEAGRAVADFRARHRDLRTNFIGFAIRVNQWKLHPELRELESRRDRVIRKRNEILRRYASLKIKMQQGGVRG